MTKLDKEVVRRAATGRWQDIISTVGGIPVDLLDGEHHPCPLCGGKDRFRFIDETAGAVFCNKCFSTKNGDGFSAVQHFANLEFSEALKRVADFVGVKPKRVGRPPNNDPQKDLKWQPWSSSLASFFLFKKPGITEEALLEAGAKMARYKKHLTVIALPIIGPSMDTANPVGWCLYNYNGGTIPKMSKDGTITGQLKIKITYGSKPGLVGTQAINWLQTVGAPEIVWKVEGVSDMLALLSIIPKNLRERHLVTTNANGAGETPRWPASILASHNCCVLHDADQPGQAGAEQWATAIASQAAEGVMVKNIQLPYSLSETHGKDLRDWLSEGNTYTDLLDLADTTEPITVARSESGEIDQSGVKYPIQEQILKKLKIEVLYEDEGNRVRIFSTHLRKSSWIRNVESLKTSNMIQLCGPPAIQHISSDPDGEETWSMTDVKAALAYMSCERRGKGEERGVGVWQGLDDDGNEMNSVVLVGDTEGARWDSDEVLRRIIAPRADGLVLDFGAGTKDWYDFEKLEKLLIAAQDKEWRKDAIEQTVQLFSMWRWRNQEHAPTLVTGMVLATWTQTIWEWRPLVAIAGESNSGKSYLFEALGGSANHRGLFGDLAFRQSKSTEAGFRQGIGNTARVALCDEFEASKERNKILELLRASTRGEAIARGTADQKGRQTTLRHIGWVASVESGLSRQPDANRFVLLELLPAVKGQHGKLKLPDGTVLQKIGLKLLAIAIRYGIQAKAMAKDLKSAPIKGIDARTIESYGVPTAILATACDFDQDRTIELMEDLLKCVDRDDQGATDQDDLLDSILESNLNLGPAHGFRTVSQVLESEQMLLEHGERLSAAGVREVENGIFVNRKMVMRQLLKGTEWEGQRIDQILLRIPGARRSIQRLGGKPSRGVIVPIKNATHEYAEFE